MYWDYIWIFWAVGTMKCAPTKYFSKLVIAQYTAKMSHRIRILTFCRTESSGNINHRMTIPLECNSDVFSKPGMFNDCWFIGEYAKNSVGRDKPQQNRDCQFIHSEAFVCRTCQAIGQLRWKKSELQLGIVLKWTQHWMKSKNRLRWTPMR